MRGHLLTTQGRCLEDVGISDFLDISYAYAIGAAERRSDFRSSILGYMFDFNEDKAAEEDKTFAGFQKQASSMLDQLDSFTLD